MRLAGRHGQLPFRRLIHGGSHCLLRLSALLRQKRRHHCQRQARQGEPYDRRGPAVIPIGSEVYLEGLGTFIAEDVGGAIKGRKVDLFMNEHRQAILFGVQFTKAYLLKTDV